LLASEAGRQALCRQIKWAVDGVCPIDRVAGHLIISDEVIARRVRALADASRQLDIAIAAAAVNARLAAR
jgi:hypothetical protein